MSEWQDYPTWDDFALALMSKAKRADPLFWSDSRCRDMAPTWAAIFAKSGISQRGLYNAVDHYYANDASGERPTPGKIVHHAKMQRTEWLNTPKGRAWAESERLDREEERDRQLASGNWRPHGA